MKPEKIEEIAHRTAWRYSHATQTYTFNRQTLADFVGKITQEMKEQDDKAKAPDKCKWVHNGGEYFKTSCGYVHLTDGVTFCPFCGGEIEIGGER